MVPLFLKVAREGLATEAQNLTVPLRKRGRAFLDVREESYSLSNKICNGFTPVLISTGGGFLLP
jgi:hypothetical protein